LNQALDFLIEEHRYVDELQAKLFGDALVLSDIENSILENNLFGVDLNDESVEIAKLSLWLRTAQPNRKLNDLNSNIKCGNSLIDDLEVAGEKAFNWQEAFPLVFAKGGFDVIIGNPPYVVYIKSNFGQNVLNYINKRYSFSEYNPNTYALFTELALSKLIKDNGYLGFIIPNTWLDGQYFSNMRNGVYSKQVEEIVNLKNTAFNEVVETVVLHIRNAHTYNRNIKLTHDIISDNFQMSDDMDFAKYCNGINPFTSKSNGVIQRLDNLDDRLGKHVVVYRGLETRNNKLWLSESKKSDSYIPILLGSDVNKYKIDFTGTYVNFIQKEMKSNANIDMYNQPKILMRRTGVSIIATLDEEHFMVLKNLYLLIPNKKNNIYSLLAQLNSKLFGYYHNLKSGGENKAFAQFKGTYISDLPIRFSNQFDFKTIVYKRIEDEKRKSEIIEKFKRTIQRKSELQDLPKKLQNWYLLSYAEFIKELTKKKIKLSLSEEAEWEDYFNQESKKALDLKNKIDKTDKEIDMMVYELYGLSEEEIKIVESN
jgi:hypothetical protein